LGCGPDLGQLLVGKRQHGAAYSFWELERILPFDPKRLVKRVLVIIRALGEGGRLRTQDFGLAFAGKLLRTAPIIVSR
jgi:hypothetical protein